MVSSEASHGHLYDLPINPPQVNGLSSGQVVLKELMIGTLSKMQMKVNTKLLRNVTLQKV
jgi:hypothetical protein